jgi:hypothetical protein
MFPFFPGPMQAVDLLPPKLAEPVQVEFTFVGGSLDGTKHVGTKKHDIDDGGTLRVTIKNEVYVYSGNNTFTYEGERADHANEKEAGNA